MPRYMETARQANEVAKRLMEMIQSGFEGHAAELVAQLVNLGVRCSPRGVQHTVRLNAVREACKDLPVKVTMEERKDSKTGKTYHALVAAKLGGSAQVVEEFGGDE